jgi:hypothetical protein
LHFVKHAARFADELLPRNELLVLGAAVAAIADDFVPLKVARARKMSLNGAGDLILIAALAFCG